MNRGFTLIELLVVIAVISMLSSVILASLNSARVRARDAKTRVELRQINSAINLYYDKYGYYPANTYPNNYCSNQANFLQSVVAEGLLPASPVAPNNAQYPYCYYRYGPGGAPGAIVTGYLEYAPSPTVDGYPGTCRPWEAGMNWCDRSINGYYCLCNPY